MTEKDLRQAIMLGHEQRATEFKGPGTSSDKQFLAKVIRAMLGMSNKPDGGVVVIGVDEDGLELQPTGLSAEELRTWTYDTLATHVSAHADPYLDFRLETIWMDDKVFVVVTVNQFDMLPVICKKDCFGVLRKGALYVRPRAGRVETVEVPSHVEMREILQIAAEAIAREIIASNERVYKRSPNAEPSFDAEAEGIL